MSYSMMMKGKQATFKSIILCAGFALISLFFTIQVANAGPKKATDANANTEAVLLVQEKTDDDDLMNEADKPAATESDILQEAPAIAAEDKTAYRCYDQTDGTVECVCNTAESCVALKSADVCAPDSEWGKEDGYGGCQKKGTAATDDSGDDITETEGDNG